MDRAEKAGLGIAAAGHLLLFGLLSIGFLATPNPAQLDQQPIAISLVKDVGIEAQAPQPVAEPAASIAPDTGTPEDAAPPAPSQETAAPAESEPAPPRPAPSSPKEAPRPIVASKPAPRAQPSAKPKPTPQKSAPSPEPAAVKNPTAKKVGAAASPLASKTGKSTAAKAQSSVKSGNGRDESAKASRPRGSRLGDDFLKGLSDQPSKSKTVAAPATKVGAQALANIASAILRQVQPCANRQVTPGPGAERIRVTINLKLNRDGSLAAKPRVIGHEGVDADNGQYVDRVDDLAIATFVGCSPLQGLPDELYDVQNGWSNFSLRYKLPG